MLIADWDELQYCPVDKKISYIDIRRVSASEVLVNRDAEGLFKFPCLDNRLKQGNLGGDDTDVAAERRQRLVRRPVGRPKGRKNNPKAEGAEAGSDTSGTSEGSSSREAWRPPEEASGSSGSGDTTMAEDFSKDYWTIRSEFIRIHHVTPRTSPIDPSKSTDLPIPSEYIDIFRETRTDIGQERYGRVLTNEIVDIWHRAPGAEQPADLPEPWTGSTTF